MSKTAFPARLLLSTLLVSLGVLASACVFGGDDEDSAEPTATVPLAPAISRSGPTPTETPFGGPTPRPTLPPPPTAVRTPGANREAITGLVSVVYSFPFIWPADGPITSFMSPEHPNGIDIGLESIDSRPVRAAAGGRVTSAGGSDDEALGISVVIDHGNGVTTTYGHLSELMVSEGDEVEIGEIIGIGGSTGDATGIHLHFEVRKDGETVDPLHVLPSAEGDTTAVQIDCATTPFTLPSGSQALINFDGLLGTGEEVVSVDAVPLNGGPGLEASVENESEVHVESPIDFDGPDGLDSYDLDVTVDNSSENRVITCGFVVQRHDVPTTFYVRAEPPATNDDGDDGGEDGEGAADEAGGEGEEAGPATAGADAATPEPEPTATPNPWAGTPNYGIPANSGGSSGATSGGTSGGVQTPNYGIPSSGGGGGGSGGVQTPNYGIPFGNSTPTP